MSKRSHHRRSHIPLPRSGFVPPCGNGPGVNPLPARCPQCIARWADRLSGLVPGGYRRIGVIWAGRQSHSNDRNRSAVLTDFMPLANVPGLALLALQKGPKTSEAGTYYGRAPLINLGAEIEDYDDTMAILQNLDLLVTVDTSVAHLAGAMGRPVWIMLPQTPDWRWLLGRSDTLWYPTARLFRQQTSSRWGNVVNTIAEALAAPSIPLSTPAGGEAG